MRLSACLILLSLLPLQGCHLSDDSSTKLNVGTVDVMRVMEERPETIRIRLDWSAQAGHTYLALSDVKSQEEYDALQAQIAKNSEEWQKRMDAFMEDSIARVERETTNIAKERGLDLVVVDNPLTKTVRYHSGEDISLDVLIRLQDQDG